MINDLDADVAEETAAEIGADTAVYACDLTKEGEPEKLVQTAVDSFGKVDILINNAGYTLDAPVHKMSDDWYQRMLDIHLTVPFRMIRAVAPYFRDPRGGRGAAKDDRNSGDATLRSLYPRPIVTERRRRPSRPVAPS